MIFLVAPSPAAPRRQRSNVRSTTYQAVARAVKTRPGSSRDRVADRIGIATWREWFPGPFEASDRFTGLRVGRRIGNAHWEPCDMWDPTQLPLPDESPTSLREVIRNSALLAQTPPRIRRRHDPAAMSAALVRQRVGELRDAAPLLGRSGTRAIGRGQGATRDACLPARLIGPVAEPKDAARQPVRTPEPTEAAVQTAVQAEPPRPVRRVVRRRKAKP